MDNKFKNLCLVNEDDEIIGTQKALYAHHKHHYSLHRAFSVFLFDDNNKLLMQKRSKEKLVFPSVWTNTCCSHPFINTLSFTDPVEDCKIHALARLKYELGIDGIMATDLRFIGRILYKAVGSEGFGIELKNEVRSQKIIDFNEPKEIENFSFSPEDFCEYELDYIFVCKMERPLKINPSEVEEILYLSKEDLKEFIKIKKCSPWLLHILDHKDIFKQSELEHVKIL